MSYRVILPISILLFIGVIFLYLFWSTLSEPQHIQKKRKAFEYPPPILWNEIEYSISKGTIWKVIATDIKTKETIWERQIYTIKYDNNLEKDIQDVYINKLEIRDNNLIIYREDGKIYSTPLEK